MTPTPLTDTERKAAEQIGRGVPQATVARDTLGGSTAKVRTLLKREDFQALIEEAREAATPPAPVPGEDKPTPRAVLEEGLVATTRSGDPALPIRMDAAAKLARLEQQEADGQRANATVERELVTLDADLDAQVRRILVGAPEAASVYVMIAARDCGPNASGATIHALSGGLWKPFEGDVSVPWGTAPTAADSDQTAATDAESQA